MTGELSLNPRETGFDRLDLPDLFGNANPVILEIGSGKGRFLIASAMERPDANFIGIEKSLHYHRVIGERVRKRGLQNLRLINHDAFPVLQKMIPDSSIDEVHIYFPDPWPRPREQKRRIIRPEVMAELRRVMRPDSSGIYVTDHREYFESAAPVIESFFRAERRIQPGDTSWPDGSSGNAPSSPDGDAGQAAPRTNYEAKYRKEGRKIFEVRFWR